MNRLMVVTVVDPDGCAGRPGPDAVHLAIEAAEASGRLLLCRLDCGCGELDGVAFTSSAEDLWLQVEKVLATHPRVRRLVIARPAGLGPRDDDYARWALRHQAEFVLRDRHAARLLRNAPGSTPVP